MAVPVLSVVVFADAWNIGDVGLERFEYSDFAKAQQRHNQRHIIGLAVFHNGNTLLQPTVTVFRDFDMYGIKALSNDIIPPLKGLDVRTMNFPPAGAKAANRSFYRYSGLSAINLPLPSPEEACMSGMDAVFYSLDQNDPRYDDLQLRMFAKVAEIHGNQALWNGEVPIDDFWGLY